MTEVLLTLLGLAVTGAVAYFTAQHTARMERARMREEMKLEYSVEAAIRALLSNPNYKKRSIRKIKHHLRGFSSDDELRLALIRAGAVAFSGNGDDESWGLVSRNEEDFK